MSGSSFYKHAFWLLLIMVAGFQIIITIVAHSRHEDTHDLLLSNGHRHVSKVPRHPLGSAQRDGDSLPSAPDSHKKKVWEEVLSTSPKIILLHNFATQAE